MKIIPSIFAAAILSAPHLATAEAPVFDFPGATAETYKTASGDDLKIYIFQPEDHAESDERPAIVFFFGGGWNGGSPSQFVQHSEYLASRGMVAMVADYRVKTRQGTTARECVADGKSAVRWIRKNADRLGIDPQRIAAGGGSAGGHVAASTGMIDAGDEKGEDMTISSKSNALVLFNPVYDNNPEDGWGGERIADYWEEISPAHHITTDDPPAVVFLGTKDNLIPVEVAERFQKKMKEVGLKSELHLYKDQPHGFFNQSKDKEYKVFPDTIRKMDQFLTEIGYLTGEPDEEMIQKIRKPDATTKTKG